MTTRDDARIALTNLSPREARDVIRDIEREQKISLVPEDHATIKRMITNLPPAELRSMLGDIEQDMGVDLTPARVVEREIPVYGAPVFWDRNTDARLRIRGYDPSRLVSAARALRDIWKPTAGATFIVETLKGASTGKEVWVGGYDFNLEDARKDAAVLMAAGVFVEVVSD